MGAVVEVVPWWLVAVVFGLSVLVRAVPALPGWLIQMVEARRAIDAYRSERRRA